ncbi:thrombospondin-2-like [Saccostrea cucullata]|uniref:thrombospondin-2-like n=1 Tax=Saccostrea cuccullata TaxID=36930 RepID=UPI002ED2B35D
MGICQESRTRSCNNPEPKYGGKNCSDEATETYNCTTCPVNGQWSTWSSWGNCVYSMRLCQKSRSRSCNNPEPKYGGNNCTGEGTENTNCTSCAEPCVSDCTSKPDGDYQSCTKCEKFAQCQNGTLVEKDCPGGLFWDDSKKRCEFISTTCSIVPTS